jgi:hypothetical protein
MERDACAEEKSAHTSCLLIAKGFLLIVTRTTAARRRRSLNVKLNPRTGLYRLGLLLNLFYLKFKCLIVRHISHLLIVMGQRVNGRKRKSTDYQPSNR